MEDVFTAANEREVALTKKEAIHVLQFLLHHHNKQLGLRWSDITQYIEESGVGRKLTRTELKRFVEKNVITIQR